MKNRQRNGRHGRFDKPQGILKFGARRQRKKIWTFERLEDRHYFSATPLDLQFESISSLTPEGAAAILAREIQWVAMQQQSASSAGFETYAIPTDPNLPQQWHLLNFGQQVGSPNFQAIYARPGEDINVVPVWAKGYTGAGVTIAVVDTGIQLDHPDLVANISPTLRLDLLNLGGNGSPDLTDPANAHGTAVAGLIAATSNNIGGTGVAPGATLAPVRFLNGFINPIAVTEQQIIDLFVWEAANVDISNNSWGPNVDRVTDGPTPAMIAALRNSVIFGRGGLGVIHVFAAGNAAGPSFVEGWLSPGVWDNAAYNGWINSRYTIGVTGIDHDGFYGNVDGTATVYAESGTSVLVAAPTGSFAAINIADDWGIGSGLFTTDLTGENGINFGPFNGIEIDNDFTPNTDYTSRMNGTSGAAPLVTGVIALMLEANPNLNWRDVQEILVRSARQAAPFEAPSGLSTWQTNQIGIFRDPDPFFPAVPGVPGIPADPGDPNADPPIPPTPEVPAIPPIPATNGTLALYNPIAVPNLIDGHYQQMPARFTNGAGYTVSGGYGRYGETIGYGHGVVDAEMAVKLAEQWHTKDQNLPPELTYTTFVNQPGLNIPAAQISNAASGRLLVPGALGGTNGTFINFWNEYFRADNPNNPNDGPFSGNNPPTNTRGTPYLELGVPPDNTMRVEHVELKVQIGGGAAGKDNLRLLLVSPEGTFSEMNPFYVEPTGAHSIQIDGPTFGLGSATDIDPDDGNFIWTFSTNRSWGERSDAAIQYDPLTGNPISNFGSLLTQGWRLYVENWSTTQMSLQGFEVVWHGSKIDAATKRIQGFVGIDENQDRKFNYSRVIQSTFDIDSLTAESRLGEVVSTFDVTQERFASNVTLQAKRTSDGAVVAQFVTGADGNYYFDLVSGDYTISISEVDGVPVNQLVDAMLVDDPLTPDGYLSAYKQEWYITPEWFTAWNHESVGTPFTINNLVTVDDEGVPEAFRPIIAYFPDPFDPTVLIPIYGASTADGLRNINFLLDVGAPPAPEFNVSGIVYADVNGDGQFNGDDVAAPGFRVYVDLNSSGQFEISDLSVFTDANGHYSMTVPVTEGGSFRVGVVPLNAGWIPTNPASGLQQLLGFAGDVVPGINFGLRPVDGFGTVSGTISGSILGVVFEDKFNIGVRDSFEAGVSGIRVYVDANTDGMFNDGEKFTLTNANGAYFLSNVAPGSVRVRIDVPGQLSVTTPASGFRTVALKSNGIEVAESFGLRNDATRDFGDLAGYPTLLADNGPRHTLVAGFRLGAKIDGELDGQPTANADGDDAVTGDEDGVVVVSNGGQLNAGVNTLRVTVQGVGGYLNGWIDWNDDGDWDDNGEHVITDLHLNEGANGLSGVHDIPVTATSQIVTGALAARFRWGTAGVDYVGSDTIGEVEDYRFANAFVPTFAPGDYDKNGSVDSGDYQLWRDTFGSQTDLRADGNGDGRVNAADYTIWRNNKTQPAAGAGVELASAAAFTENSYVGLGSGASLGGGTTSEVSEPVNLAAGSSLLGGPNFSLAGLQFAPMVTVRNVKSVFEQKTAESDALANSAELQLLDDSWMAYAAEQDDDVSQPLTLAADRVADEDAMQLAVAALFDDGGDWQQLGDM